MNLLDTNHSSKMNNRFDLLSREELIAYIKANDQFYENVNFSGHSNNQLIGIKKEIEKTFKKKKTDNCIFCKGTGVILHVECYSCKGTGIKL